jgi:hypothetical protein
MLRAWLLNFLLLCIAMLRSIEAKHSKDFRALMDPRARIAK